MSVRSRSTQYLKVLEHVLVRLNRPGKSATDEGDGSVDSEECGDRRRRDGRPFSSEEGHVEERGR